MNDQPISTISEFFKRTNTSFRVYDMGRRVTPLSNKTFQAFENFEVAYPSPLQQQAWFGLLCWNAQEESEHFIWFLRMPLDELGMLVPAARDDFIFQLLEHLGVQVAARNEGKDFEDVLNESAYGFKPAQNRMAVFHAKALRQLSLAPSHYYQPTRDYLTGNLGYEQWQFLGVQGLADVCARWDQDDNAALLINALAALPEMPWTVLCECLENECLDTAMVEAIVARVQAELDLGTPSVPVIAGGLRAISAAKAVGLRQRLIEQVLVHPVAKNVEVLVAVSGRCWEDLKQASIARLFLEALVSSEAISESVGMVLADLLFIPGMREPLLTQLRNPDRSEKLAQALDRFFA